MRQTSEMAPRRGPLDSSEHKPSAKLSGLRARPILTGAGMKLQELVAGAGVRGPLADPEVPISSVVYDSRQATSGSLFVAIRGEKDDGNHFAAAAVERILARFALQLVVAGSSDQHIIAWSATQEIVAVAAFQSIASAAADQHIVAIATEQHQPNSGHIGAVDHIVTGTRVDVGRNAQPMQRNGVLAAKRVDPQSGRAGSRADHAVDGRRELAARLSDIDRVRELGAIDQSGG